MNKDRLQMYISVTKITIVLCWLSLFYFWAIKLFGGNWFEIMVENENLMAFSKFIQNSYLLHLSNLITTLLANYFIFCSIDERLYLRKYNLIYYLCASISMWVICNFTSFEILKMGYGYVLILLYSIFTKKGIKKIYGLLAIIFETLFTVISMATRNLPLWYFEEYLIFLILSIDLYIMYALYYLYINLNRLKKEI
jgi:hypothetical protein